MVRKKQNHKTQTHQHVPDNTVDKSRGRHHRSHDFQQFSTGEGTRSLQKWKKDTERLPYCSNFLNINDNLRYWRVRESEGRLREGRSEGGESIWREGNFVREGQREEDIERDIHQSDGMRLFFTLFSEQFAMTFRRELLCFSKASGAHLPSGFVLAVGAAITGRPEREIKWQVFGGSGRQRFSPHSPPRSQ